MLYLKKSDANSYKNKRKNFLYYKVIKIILKFLSDKNYTILDVGSANMDMISDLNFKERVSVDIVCPIESDKVIGIKTDFFDYKEPYKFDIVTCFQVIEHVENAKKFTQKLLNTGKLVIISLPYKWAKGLSKYHCQDPVDERKLYSWTNKKPVCSFYIKDLDNNCRFISIYGNIFLFAVNCIPQMMLLSLVYSKKGLLKKIVKTILLFTKVYC